MKTKGKLLTILAAMIFALSIVTIVACNDVHDHTYGAWEIVDAPTESTEGRAIRKCSSGDSTDEAILKVLTDTDFWTVSTTPATHTATGETVYTAKPYDNLVYTVTIPAIAEHEYGDWSVDPANAPTESAAGKLVRTCKANDGASESVNVPALSDDTFWTVESTTPAGHVEDGSKVYSCEYGKITVVLPAIGHSYGAWTLDPDHMPTKVLPGKAIRMCTADDGASLSKDIPALTDASVWRLKSSTPADHENDGSEVYVSEYGLVTVVIHAQGHNYGEWTIETEPTLTASGKASRTCLDDGHVDSRNVPELTDTDYWEKTTVPQSYNSAGKDIYTAKEESSLTVTIITSDKLVAPYDSKTYFPFRLDTKLSNTVTHDTMTKQDSWISNKIDLDANGESALAAFPFNGGNNKIAMVDDATGAILWTSGTKEAQGFVDMASGIMVVQYSGYDSVWLFICADSATVNASNWRVGTDTISAIVCEYTIDDNNTTLGILIVNDVVTFGVTFKDMGGETLSAENCHNAAQVYAYIGSDKVQDFGYGFDGTNMRELDGNEGNYTAIGDVTGSFVISGVGSVKFGDDNGTYSATADGKINAIINNDYYRLTLNKSEMTCSVSQPKVTVRYNVNGGNEIADAQFTPYITAELPTPTHPDDTKLFKGWYYDGEFNEKVTEFTPEMSENGFTLYARWGVKITVNLSSSIEYDGYQTSLEITTGDVYTEALPDLSGIFKNGYKFIDWYIDAEFETALPEGAEASDSDEGITLYAKWDIAGIWNLQNAEKGDGFVYDSEKGAWKSTNQGKGNTSSIMEILVVSGTLNVSFEYAASSEGGSWDIIQIFYYENADGSTTETKTDGGKIDYANLVWKDYEKDLVVGNKIQFNYKKDSSGDHNDDTGYIRNLTINGMRVTTLGAVDFMNGTYTCADMDDLVLDGNGGFTWGDKSGTYSKQAEGDAYDMYVVDGGNKTEYYVLNLGAGTYTVDKTMVTLTLDYGTTGEARENKEVNKNIAQALAEKAISGFKFRGWYDNDAYTGKVITSVTLTADATYYAKYDRAITLNYNHMVTGTTDHQESKFENDTVGTLYEMPESVTNGEKLFVGWFTKDGTDDGDWGEQVTKDTVIAGLSESEAVMTVYAQWVAPHVLMGTYYYANLDPSETGIAKETDTFSATDSSNLTIDAVGKTNGWKNGTIVDYDAETGKFALDVNGTKYYGGSDAVNGFVYIDYASGKTTPYHDIGFLVKAVDGVGAVSSIDIAWDKGCTKLVQITYNDTESSVKNLFIYNRVVYGDVTWAATDSDGNKINDIRELDAKVANITITKGQTNWMFAKDSNNLVPLDGTQGTYTCDGEENIVLNGAGGITYDGKTGTVTAKADNVYTAKFVDATYILTIDVAAKTYTLVDDKVTVSYDFGTTNGSLASSSVYRGIAFTLPTAPEIAGFVFRGWYDNDEFTGSAIASVTPDEDTVVYANYDKAITITIVYGNGMDDVTITDKFANDVVTVALPEEKNDLFAVGWYTDDAFTTAWTSGSKVTDDLVLYCKWTGPSPLMGSYKTYEIFGSTTASSKSALSIDKANNFSGLFSGALVAFNSQTGFGSVQNGTSMRYVYFNDELKAFVANYNNIDGTFTNDIYFGIQAESLTITASNCIAWDSNVSRLIKYTADGTDGYIVVLADKVIFGKSVSVVDANGQEVSSVSNYKTAGNILTLTAHDETEYVFAYIGSAYVMNDGMSGTYANNALLGNISPDGFGTLTIGYGEIDYTVTDEGNIRFVYGSRMYIVSLDKTNNTYAQVQDGYAGTYTLPDGAGTITFDGLGGAGNGKTYVVSGTQVVIYDGDTSTNYGLDAENKTLLAKSAVAGMVFEQQGNSSRTITFDDGTDPTGKFTTYSMNITFGSGRMDGNKIVLTVTAQSGNYCAVGDIFVFEFDAAAGTLTFKLSESSIHPSGYGVDISEYGFTEGKVFNAKA